MGNEATIGEAAENQEEDNCEKGSGPWLAPHGESLAQSVGVRERLITSMDIYIYN